MSDIELFQTLDNTYLRAELPQVYDEIEHNNQIRKFKPGKKNVNGKETSSKTCISKKDYVDHYDVPVTSHSMQLLSSMGWY